MRLNPGYLLKSFLLYYKAQYIVINLFLHISFFDNKFFKITMYCVYFSMQWMNRMILRKKFVCMNRVGSVSYQWVPITLPMQFYSLSSTEQDQNVHHSDFFLDLSVQVVFSSIKSKLSRLCGMLRSELNWDKLSEQPSINTRLLKDAEVWVMFDHSHNLLSSYLPIP